jgi:uncharacterized membrane protein YadS
MLYLVHLVNKRNQTHKLPYDQGNDVLRRALLHIGVLIMGLNATFNNISVISWQSVLWVEETGVTGKTHETASH